MPPSDLTVPDIAWAPSSPARDERVTFVALVVNGGEGAAAGFAVDFLLDGTFLLDSIPVGPLPPGRWVWVASDAWTATAGDHTIRAIADASQVVEEADEGNNDRAAALFVEPCPVQGPHDFVACFDAEDSLPQGWNASGLWHVSACRAESGPHSLAYNRQACPTDYDVGFTTGNADTPTLTVRATPVTLTFGSWSETECVTVCPYDRRYVQVSINGGPFVIMLSEGDGGWFTRTVDIDISVAAGDTLKVRFSFDNRDGISNAYEGWYVDTVKVANASAASPP